MFLLSFYRSTIGKKVIMGVTGLIGIGYVIVHMLGNLQAFAGQSKLNNYGAMLKGPLIELTWLVRIVLIVAVVLHVLMAYQLTQRAHAARPVAYRNKEPQVSTLASRTMRWGGVLLLAFIVLHILHFTTRNIDPAGWGHVKDAAGRFDLFGDVVGSFRIWWVTLFYEIAMLFLGLHLYHGAWASIRTLGYAKPGVQPLKRQIALVVSLVVAIGFALVPAAVFVGIIR